MLLQLSEQPLVKTDDRAERLNAFIDCVTLSYVTQTHDAERAQRLIVPD